MLISTATLSIIFPAIDPVIVQAGPLAIRWYALAYVAGILIGWWYIGKLDRKKPKALSQAAYDDFIIWAILGILLGGRLGYVLFYNPDFFFSNPAEIIAVWKGGMSFHGGLAGSVAAIYLMCRRYKLKFWPVADIVCCMAPIGLFLGRIANFINAELYGRITDVPWGVIFPGDPFARHPSQIYEALTEGFLLFCIMFFFAFYTKSQTKSGKLSGIFLIGYSIFRIFSELFREPDIQLGFIVGNVTMGQILSIPMLLFGIYLIVTAKPRKA